MTVRELVAALEKLPMDAPVRYEHADSKLPGLSWDDVNGARVEWFNPKEPRIVVLSS